MQKKILIIIAIILGLGGGTLIGFFLLREKGSDTIHGTYDIYAHSYDWGICVDEAIIKLDYPLDRVDISMFEVSELMTIDGEVRETERLMTDVYLCDEKGEKLPKDAKYGKYIRIGLEVFPEMPLLYELRDNDSGHEYFGYYDDLRLDIRFTDDVYVTSLEIPVDSFTISKEADSVIRDIDVYEHKVYDMEGYGYSYNCLTHKEKGSDTLVVFLHGLDSSACGINADAYLAGAIVDLTTFIDPGFTSKVKPVSVLVPQCPTFWMDVDGHGDPNVDGFTSKAASSYYTESLHELINTYRDEVKATKVVIMGASNGGFMSLVMALNYGNEYQGYIMAAEALLDSCLTDVDIQVLAECPLYFVYADGDYVEPPKTHAQPTVKRLWRAGAGDVHLSTSPEILDLTNQYFDAKGDPHHYNDHASSIYLLNDWTSCKDCGVSAWSWLAETLK